MPVAATENVAVCPTVTVAFCGCAVIWGACDCVAELTVRVAALLVMLPAELLTVTANG